MKLLAVLCLGLLFPITIDAAEIVLPTGTSPPPVEFPWFPSRLHSVVWRNWELVPTVRLAAALNATPQQIEQVAASMGLPENRPVPDRYRPHIYKTILRRNWHLLPYEQLLTLVDMSPEELATLLHEDDFLYIKFGSNKPKCDPVRYEPPDAASAERAAEIRSLVETHFGESLREPGVARFAFIEELSETHVPPSSPSPHSETDSLRYLYSYVAAFGDPLLDTSLDPYPDGLLERLAASGVNGVWMHVVLRQLAPGGPDFPEWGADHETRLANLRKIVDRAAEHGIKIYLYINEPRAMPHEFFTSRPELAGVREGELTTVCTSDERTRNWLRNSLTHVFREVPGLGGVFTITASENLTNCASHNRRDQCPRCRERTDAEIIAEVNATVEQGVHAAAPEAKVIAWDWGWNRHGDAAEHISLLPDRVALQSVSEWALPIERGGIVSTVGEYSISAVGPGPRATRHWALAKERGLEAIAKVQVNNTWELSSVPFLPVLDLVARHAHNLASADVDGLMLSWSLGGSPSPNLDVACRLIADKSLEPAEVLSAVARERYGDAAEPHIRKAWTSFSDAFQEFPYNGGVVYVAPQQFGPANPLYGTPTGRRATMIGFPYDDLDRWRGPYPRDVFTRQFAKVAEGWKLGLAHFEAALEAADDAHRSMIETDLALAKAAQLHFASTANQSRFVIARDAVLANPSDKPSRDELQSAIDDEIAAAESLYRLTRSDSRIGFEASNGYYYVPLDLVEKVVCCEFLRGEFSNP